MKTHNTEKLFPNEKHTEVFHSAIRIKRERLQMKLLMKWKEIKEECGKICCLQRNFQKNVTICEIITFDEYWYETGWGTMYPPVIVDFKTMIGVCFLSVENLMNLYIFIF